MTGATPASPKRSVSRLPRLRSGPPRLRSDRASRRAKRYPDSLKASHQPERLRSGSGQIVCAAANDAKCQKATYAVQQTVSLFDHLCQERPNAPQQKASLENLVGTAGQRQRNGDAERTGRLQVDEHLDFGRLLHWQIGRLATFKNSPGIDSDEAMCFRNVGPVAHQASGRSELAPLVDRGNRVLNRQGGELLGMAGEECVAPNYQPTSSQLSQLREDQIEVLFSACVQDMYVDAKGLGRRKHFALLRLGQ